MAIPSRINYPTNPGRVILAENVRILELEQKTDAVQASAKPTATGAGIARHEPEITLLKDGDRVKTIVINCTCGRVTTLDCEY